MTGCQHCPSNHAVFVLTMRQFVWRWLYGSVWVSALHIPVGVGHRWIHGASTLSCVKWHPVKSQGTTPSTTSFHVRLPQPKFQSRRNLYGLFRSDGKHPDGLTLVKVHTLDIASLRSESPPQKHSGVVRVLNGFDSFTCTPTRSPAIGMSHTCLCLSSYNWYLFTDPGGMED